MGKVTENGIKVQLQIELCPSDRALLNSVVTGQMVVWVFATQLVCMKVSQICTQFVFD